MTENPESALETTTITHPTPTDDPAEQTVPGPEDGADWDQDDDHEDVGSSADAPAGAADGDDLGDDLGDDPHEEGAAGGNGS